MTALTGERVSLDDPAREMLHRRHALELLLVDAVTSGGGISRIMRASQTAAGRGLWLFDQAGRLVTPPTETLRRLSRPSLDVLLEEAGPLDTTATTPTVIDPAPGRDLVRRHAVSPIAHRERLFGWLVAPEFPGRLTEFDRVLIARTAQHLANEYATQQRIARVAWDAKATLARQMVRGSICGQEMYATAEYLGVDVELDRVVAYLVDDEPPPERAIAEEVARDLGVEVLGVRGSHGTTLLIEAPDDVRPVVMVGRTKKALSATLRGTERSSIIAGVSAVASPGGFKRAYREAREATECIDRFAHPANRILAVDELGPARLFLANSDLGSVERYVQDVLGALLTEAPGTVDLLRTLQAFFDAGRRVRESAVLLGVHENTVRLRLVKIHALTGLDASAGTNDQLTMQTALLVLRLQGHPAIATFEEIREVDDEPDGRAADAGWQRPAL